jgi:coenzyme F420 hydrogenase subunit beta
MAIDTESFVPLMKKSLGFVGLKRDVVDQGLCSGCGACGAFCDRLVVDEDGPKLVKDCTLDVGSVKCSVNGTCYDNCPMVSHSRSELDMVVFGRVREDSVLGVYERIVGVRARDKGIRDAGQDGGAVTALLECAVDMGLVAGAAVVPRDEVWRPVPELVAEKGDLRAAAGTKYARAVTPVVFGRSLAGYRRLAVVGTGCQIEGLRRLLVNLLGDAFVKTRESDRPLGSLLVGLFCYENFPYSRIREKLVSDPFNVSLEDVVKIDIVRGKIVVSLRDGGEVVHPVKLFNDIVPECCSLCDDFAATFADVSVGSVGSGDGWSTVIVRSGRGLELLEAAVEGGYVEVSLDVSLEEVRKTSASKDRKRRAVRKRREAAGALIPNYE